MNKSRPKDTPGERTVIETLQSRNDRLGALASIAARIGVYQDTRRLAREAMQAIADLMTIKTAILLLVDEESGSLVFHEAFNLPSEEVERYNRLTSWDDSIEGVVVRRKEPVLIADVSTDSRALHYPYGSMSLGLIPLLARDHVIGVLSVTTTSPQKLDQSDMEFLLTLGSQLGIYLENARLLEELKESNRQLTQQNLDLEELLSVISHDLRSPLATIGGYASLLIKKGDKLNLEERARFAETIFRKTRETARRFDDLLSLFKTTNGEEKEEPVEFNVRTVLEVAIEEAGLQYDLRRFKIDIPDDLPLLSGFPTHLIHIFANLLSNSFKFIGDQKIPAVTISYERLMNSGDAIHRFSVSDNGAGIPEDYISGIFRPFARVPTEQEIPGSGVGLASVQRIVRSHRGTIDIRSIEGEGTTVTFTLPWKEIGAV